MKRVKPLAPLANILTRVYHVFATLFSSHRALNDSWKENHWSRTLSTLEMPYLFFPSHSCITARKTSIVTGPIERVRITSFCSCMGFLVCLCVVVPGEVPWRLARSSQGMSGTQGYRVLVQSFPLSRLWEDIWQMCRLSPVEARDPGASSARLCNYCTITGHTAVLLHVRVLWKHFQD